MLGPPFSLRDWQQPMATAVTIALMEHPQQMSQPVIVLVAMVTHRGH
jgi:hypothetical protein